MVHIGCHKSFVLGELNMPSAHRLGFGSLVLLLACGEEPQKIEPIVPEPNIELNVDTVDFGELLIQSISWDILKSSSQRIKVFIFNDRVFKKAPRISNHHWIW